MDSGIVFFLWLVLCIVITNAGNLMEDPEFRAFLETKRQNKQRYLARKALGDFEIIPLQINGRNIPEELRDMMELEVINSLGLPADFDDMLPTEPEINISKRSGISSVESDRPEKDEDSYSNDPLKVGSIRGIPGVHFPDYTDIPITSFSCVDKPHLPGFYADMDTGCQVFHVCWNDRRETFLCPLGTTFNQALLACDYWYSSNCSLALHYYNVNKGETFDNPEVKVDDDLSSMIESFLGSKANKSKPMDLPAESAIPASVLSFVTQFMPVKAKVTFYPESEGQPSKIVASASVGRNKKLTRKAKSLNAKKTSGIKATLATNTDDEASEIPTWCVSYRHFVYRLNERFDGILDEFKNVSSLNNYLETHIGEIRKFLRYLDPAFDKFDISEANHETEKLIEDFLRYLSSVARELFTDVGVIPTATENSVQYYDPGYYDPGLVTGNSLPEIILNKIRKFLLVLNPDFGKFDPEKAKDNADKDLGSLPDPLPTKYDDVLTTTETTSKYVDVPRCEKLECKPSPKPTLTPLNQRFIIKPVVQKKMPVVSTDHSLPAKKPQGSKSIGKGKSSLSTSKLSEETKKALLLNYMKLLKIDN